MRLTVDRHVGTLLSLRSSAAVGLFSSSGVVGS